MESFQSIILKFVKEHLVVVIVGFLGICFLITGLVGIAANDKGKKIQFQTTDAGDIGTGHASIEEKREIAVDVSGAVAKPGVYLLKKDSRVQDAILEAGGMTDNADRKLIAQSVNLAARLTDGAKLYIPLVGEQMTGSQGGIANSSDATNFGSSAALININQASASELDTLTGVGSVTAGKIIANRPYTSIQNLVEKKIVGSSVFEKIKDKISVF